MIEKSSNYVQNFNTETYDYIYYYFKMQEVTARFVTNTNNHFFYNYPPLLDSELVSIGFNLPRLKRFFNLFHRSHIYNSNPQVAKIRTTEGVSASLNQLNLIKDVSKYIGNKGRRLLKKIGQRTLNKTYFQENPNNPNLINSIYHTSLINEIFTSLKDHNIINSTLELSDIQDRFLGKILTLGLLLKELS